MKYKSVIFLDFDGVLNCQLFYNSPEFDINNNTNNDEYSYHELNCSRIRIQWLNELCEETGAVIVISGTMRNSFDVNNLQELFNRCGGTFKIIDKTGRCKCRIRGVEIHEWLKENSSKYFDIPYYDFRNYAIIDDDNDMLLCQWENFFQVDNYSGLTPTTCYKIKRFLLNKTF
jgi:hypothetical protein